MKKIMACLLLVCAMLTCGAALAATNATVRVDAVATRTGPGTKYTEPGSFLYRGAPVKVHTKVWDNVNEIYWVQIEFTSGNERYRVYTGDWRLNVNLNAVPSEMILGSSWLTESTRGYAGPGYDYHWYGDNLLYAYCDCLIMEVENGFALIETSSSSKGWTRCWVPLSLIVDGYVYDGENTYPEGFGSNASGGSSWDYGGMCSEYPVGRTCAVWVDSGRARSGPGTQYEQVAYINYGDRLLVLGRRLGNTGKDWYKVCIDGQECWISSGLVTVDGNSSGTVNGVPIDP